MPARPRLIRSRWRAAPFQIALIVVAALAVYFLYRASILDGTQSERAFVVGLLLALSAAAAAWGHKAHVHAIREHQWEATMHHLAQDVRVLRKEQDALRQDVHSRIAVQEWLEVFDRMDAHQAKGWVHLNRRD